MRFKIQAAALAAMLLAACSSVTTLSSTRPDTQLAVKEKRVTLPASQDLKSTSFGNYEFKAVADGHDPFYGILPLSFRGGRLAADIILFAPAAFFNLRTVFPYYEFDVEKGLIRYRKTASEPWNEYRPKPEEAARARAYFEGGAGSSAAAPAAQ